MKTIKVLIAEKNSQLSKLLNVGLSGYGYDVLMADTREEILAALACSTPDLLLLHATTGIEAIPMGRELRQWNNIPIIVISPVDRQQLKVQAFEAGADDYVVEPFSIPELEARIRAILRRTTDQDMTGTQSHIHVNGLEIDLAKRRVTLCNTEVHFTPTEYDVLRLLAVNAGKILTHSMIATKIWGPDTTNGPHNVRVFINTIRKKLREDPTNRYILSHPGIGYEFAGTEPAPAKGKARRMTAVVY